MRKKKLYIITVLLMFIFLFSFSALCNQCGATGQRDKIDVDKDDPEDKELPEEIIEVEEESQEEEVEEDIVQGPAIELEIYEGPLFSEANDICYYRIEAIVMGNPEPIIEFSKDDSNGAWGPKKVQVNIKNPEETYTLTATATNSVGSVSESLVIEWGCDK